MRRIFFVAILSLAAIASAETRKERNARVGAEWDKFENSASNVCGAGGVLYFNYSPLDRRTYVPVLFSPSLPRDLLKSAVTALGVKDEKAKATIAEAFNAALNEHIDELRNGTYNIINVIMKKGPSFAITPREHQGGDVLIWVYRSGSDRLLDVLGGDTPSDTVSVLSPGGALTLIDKSTRPKWLASEDFFQQAGGTYHNMKMRVKHYVKCE